jgi:glycerol-3-phosphate cytidylyltransferase
MTNIITFGTYDLFHQGHYNILKRAKYYDNKKNNLIVGISSDELNKIKGKITYETLDERIKKVKETKLVDIIFIEESLMLKQHYIDMHKANILIMGDDWKGYFDWVNIPCVYLPRTENISTSWLKLQDITKNKCYTFLFYDAHSKKHYEYFELLTKYFNSLGIKYFLYDETQVYNIDSIDAIIQFNKKNEIIDLKFHEQIITKPIILIDHGASNSKWFLSDISRYNSIDYFLVAGPKHKQSMDAFFGDNGKVISTGFIKSEMLFNQVNFDVDQFYKDYNLDKTKKLILYAPTWNKNTNEGLLSEQNDAIEIYKQLEKVDNIIYSLHPETDLTQILENKNKRFITHIRTSELIKICDIVISDFSSILYESAVLGKKNIQILLSSYPDNPSKYYNYPMMAGTCDLFVGGIPTLPIFLKDTIDNIDNYSNKLFEIIYYNMSCTSYIHKDACEKIVTHILNIAKTKKKNNSIVNNILSIKQFNNIIVDQKNILQNTENNIVELSDPSIFSLIIKYPSINFIIDIEQVFSPQLELINKKNIIVNIHNLNEFKKINNEFVYCILDLTKTNNIYSDNIFNTLKYIQNNDQTELFGIKILSTQINNDLIFAIQSFGKLLFIKNMQSSDIIDKNLVNRTFIVNRTSKKYITNLNNNENIYIYDVCLEYKMIKDQLLSNCYKFCIESFGDLSDNTIVIDNVKYLILQMKKINNTYYCICELPYLIKCINNNWIKSRIEDFKCPEINSRKKILINGSSYQHINSTLINNIPSETNINCYNYKGVEYRKIIYDNNEIYLPSYMFFLDNECNEYVFLYKYIIIKSDNMTNYNVINKIDSNNTVAVGCTHQSYDSNYIQADILLVSDKIKSLIKNSMEHEFNDIYNKIGQIMQKVISSNTILTILNTIQQNNIINIIEESFFGITDTECKYGMIENITKYNLINQFIYLYNYRLSYTNGMYLTLHDNVQSNSSLESQINDDIYITVNVNGINKKLKQLIPSINYGKYVITCVLGVYSISLDGKFLNKPLKYIPLLNTTLNKQKQLYQLITSYIRSHNKLVEIKYSSGSNTQTKTYYIPEKYVINEVFAQTGSSTSEDNIQYVNMSEPIFVYSLADTLLENTFNIVEKNNNHQYIIEHFSHSIPSCSEHFSHSIPSCSEHFSHSIPSCSENKTPSLYVPINNLYIQKHTIDIITEEFPITYNIFNSKKYDTELKSYSNNIKVNCNLVLDNREINFNHRSGWKYVLHMIQNNIIYNETKKPIKIVDLIEKTFSWDYVSIEDQQCTQKVINYEGKTYYAYVGDLKLKYINGKSTHILKLNNDYLIWNNEWIADKTETDELFETRRTLIDDMVLTDDWIGVWHNPHDMPLWFDYQHSPQSILKRKGFLKSLEKCKGIFVLSNYFKLWLRQQVPNTIPISLLYHPTEEVSIKFDYKSFVDNTEKCVIQIGYWLRNMCSIGLINNNKYKKVWLYGNDWAYSCLKRENEEHKKNNISCGNMNNVLQIRLSDELYDEFLSKNIAFVSVYDSSANNAVIECITRYTPLIINKHPAVVEYLGELYPMYFENMSEVNDMLNDYELIKKCTDYLKNNKQIHDKISGESFLNQFVNSEIIKQISN